MYLSDKMAAHNTGPGLPVASLGRQKPQRDHPSCPDKLSPTAGNYLYYTWGYSYLVQRYERY